MCPPGRFVFHLISNPSAKDRNCAQHAKRTQNKLEPAVLSGCAPALEWAGATLGRLFLAYTAVFAVFSPPRGEGRKEER